MSHPSVEDIKINSRGLRGTLLEGLADPVTGSLSFEDQRLVKFHGTYQQDDRDIRDERRRQKLEPEHQFMIRIRAPGGVFTPEQWLKLDSIATTHANHSLRVTTRQTFQFHGVIKRELKATMQAIQKDPSLIPLMMSPFALTPGFQGPEQPDGSQKIRDEDLDAEVGPFMMATINTKNVHRSNLLQGHAYGTDFKYDEMSVIVPGAQTEFTDLGGAAGPQPGEGPSKAEREAGFYDLLFVGIDADGRQVRGSVHGDKDPGYGSTSKIIAESAICLVKDCPDVPGGVWVPGAAMGDKLIARLQKNAGLTFKDETA